MTHYKLGQIEGLRFTMIGKSTMAKFIDNHPGMLCEYGFFKKDKWGLSAPRGVLSIGDTVEIENSKGALNVLEIISHGPDFSDKSRAKKEERLFFVHARAGAIGDAVDMPELGDWWVPVFRPDYDNQFQYVVFVGHSSDQNKDQSKEQNDDIWIVVENRSSCRNLSDFSLRSTQVISLEEFQAHYRLGCRDLNVSALDFVNATFSWSNFSDFMSGKTVDDLEFLFDGKASLFAYEDDLKNLREFVKNKQDKVLEIMSRKDCD